MAKKRGGETNKQPCTLELYLGGGASAPSNLNPLICGGQGRFIIWVRAAGSHKFKPHKDVRFRPAANNRLGAPRRSRPARLGP